MRQTKRSNRFSHRAATSRLLASAVFVLASSPWPGMAQQPGQRTFPSAEAASEALLGAAQVNDAKALLEIMGPDGKQVVNSGDEAEDASSRANFVQRYQEMHRLVREPDGTTALYIGAENWPTPVPLVRKANRWYFDAKAGRIEILLRRIGRNELSTIRVCQELVTAENEYHEMRHGEYAERPFSDDGQHNGLYWRAATGESPSPIGPLLAAAVARGDAAGSQASPTPYRGYVFRILKQQGHHAAGGRKAYLVNGRMTEGFAFVAYPIEYRSSGVMTFLVGTDGILYEKDLGKQTGVIASSMKAYDPDSTWNKVEDVQEQAAGW